MAVFLAFDSHERGKVTDLEVLEGVGMAHVAVEQGRQIRKNSNFEILV
jgi:hypothetical protein